MKKAHIVAELSGWTSVAWDSWEDDENPDFGDTTGPDGFCVSATKQFTLEVPDDATEESLRADPDFVEEVRDTARSKFNSGSLEILDSEIDVEDDFEIDKDSVIFNLITKERYWEKPTYQTLEDSLNHALSYFEQFEKLPKKIVMPKIGCGLDKLDWAKVKPMIEEIFADFNVVVCYL